MLAPAPQVLFRDKKTGEPLRNGKVYFYEDNDRMTLKPVYKLTGSPPDYTYEALPNPMTLSAIGTMMDNDNNDIIAYYFPYDGNEETTTGEIELYYLRVYDENGVFQWDRQGWPNLTSQDVESQNIKNYIPNGQFLSHTDIPADEVNSLIAGQIREEVTQIAQGGWEFIQRPHPSTAVTIVTFETQEPLTNPTANPRFELVAEVKDVGNVEEQSLRLKFIDVNKFASPTQQYTYYFEAKSDNGENANATIFLIKNFGTGGDAETETQIGEPITIGTSFAPFNIHIPFGTNSGKVIGPDNDDFVAIDIRLENELQKIKVVNAVLTPNAVELQEYPQQTNAEMISGGVFGWAPTPLPSGMSLYLNPRLTKAGMEWDFSPVGKILACAYELTTDNKALDGNEIYCDKSGFLADGYSDLGIPYRRIHNKLWDSTAKITKWGNGREYLDAYISDLSPASEVRFATNKAGSVTAIDAKTSGMTVKTVRTGMDLKLDGYKYGTALLKGIGNIVGAPFANATAGDSGFTVTQETYPSTAFQVFSVLTIAASGLASKYFTFSNTTTNYYIWFKVNGVGTDPTPGPTSAGFIDLNTNYTADDVSNCVRESLAGGQVSTITAIAASSITGGQYFTIYSNSGSEKTFNVWFEKDGIGSAPVASGIPIKVAILSADTAAQVADKIRIAVNMKFVGLPDARNIHLRGYSNPSTWDYDSATRITNKSVLSGTNIGTYELSQFTSHIHAAVSSSSSSTTTEATNSLVESGIEQFNGSGPGTVPGGADVGLLSINYTPEMTSTTTTSTTTTISPTGGSETRGVNMFVNFVIKI